MWQGISGHDAIAERFRATLRCGRLASTYLFVGSAGVGKKRFAMTLAKALLCSQPGNDLLEPCGRCESCQLFDAGNHPDLDVVGLPRDKSTLPVDLFIGDKEHRNRDGLCQRLALKPYLGGRKIAIIDDADFFNQESANCLLKTLEEPPPRSLVILIGTSASKQLPTIRSRAQVVRFQPLSADVVTQILVDQKMVNGAEVAKRLAAFADGSVERARDLSDPTMWEFRKQLLPQLCADSPDCVRLARSMQAFVDDAGKEAAAKRDRLRTGISFALELYQDLLRANVGCNVSADEPLQAAMRQGMASGVFQSPQRALEASEACLAALESVDRNANLALVIQKLCEELAASTLTVA